jgi:hypothetical protein
MFNLTDKITILINNDSRFGLSAQLSYEDRLKEPQVQSLLNALPTCFSHEQLKKFYEETGISVGYELSYKHFSQVIDRLGSYYTDLTFSAMFFGWTGAYPEVEPGDEAYDIFITEEAKGVTVSEEGKYTFDRFTPEDLEAEEKEKERTKIIGKYLEYSFSVGETASVENIRRWKAKEGYDD